MKKQLLAFFLFSSLQAFAELRTQEVRGRDPFHGTVRTFQVILELPERADPNSNILIFRTEKDLAAVREEMKYFPIAFAKMTKEVCAFTLQVSDWPVTSKIAQILNLNKPRPVIFIDQNTDRFALAHENQHAVDFYFNRESAWKKVLEGIPSVAKNKMFLSELLKTGVEWRGYSTEILNLQTVNDAKQLIFESKNSFVSIACEAAQRVKALKYSEPEDYKKIAKWLKEIEIKNSILPISLLL